MLISPSIYLTATINQPVYRDQKNNKKKKVITRLFGWICRKVKDHVINIYIYKYQIESYIESIIIYVSNNNRYCHFHRHCQHRSFAIVHFLSKLCQIQQATIIGREQFIRSTTRRCIFFFSFDFKQMRFSLINSPRVINLPREF